MIYIQIHILLYNMKLIQCFILFNLFIVNCLYLTQYQYKTIRKLIDNPSINEMQKNKLKNILYFSFEKWAIKRGFEFKKKHNYKLNDVSNEEIIMYCKLGLYKSIKKYNGNSSFTYFSNIYINHELYKIITEKYASSIIPKSQRIKNKKSFTNNEIIQYNKLLNTQFIDYNNKYNFYNKNDENSQINNIILSEEKQNLWMKINSLEPFSRRIFHLKYDINFNNIRTIKEIAKLMMCSEEYIRIKSMRKLLK